jgi:hypothetical protein
MMALDEEDHPICEYEVSQVLTGVNKADTAAKFRTKILAKINRWIAELRTIHNKAKNDVISEYTSLVLWKMRLLRRLQGILSCSDW